MFKTDCFAYKKFSSGYVRCSALTDIDCAKCKFYLTVPEYRKKVRNLKYKKRKEEKS